MLLRHDNAPAHVPDDDPDVIAAGNYGRTSVKLIAQPTNSPAFNINDLEFFRAIQSLQDEWCLSSVEELVGAVKKAYLEYDPKKIEDTFISLQKCMEASMLSNGDNKYKQLHLRKEYHRNKNEPIQNIKRSITAYNLAVNLLNEEM